MSEALRFDIFAKDEFSKSFDKLLGKLPSVKKLALGAAAGISAIGVSLFAMAKTTATAYDKLGKFSDQTGLTTEFLSKMAVAAEFSDVNVNTLNKSLEKLQIGIGEAGKGIGLARETLEEMEIALHQANGKMHTAESILPLLADKFQGMTDATKRTEAAQKLFGQRGIEMIKILKDGSEGLKGYADEAEAMGLVVDKQATANAAKFNDALFKVQGTLRGLKNEIGERVMPIITGLAEKFSDFAKDNREEIIKFGVAFAVTMGYIVEKGAYAIAALNDAWRGLKMLGEIQKIDTAAKVGAISKGIGWLSKQAGELIKKSEILKALNLGGAFSEGLTKAGDKLEETAEKIDKFSEGAKDNLQKLVNEGLSIAKVDGFIEKVREAIEEIKLAGEAEIEATAEKNEILLAQHDAHIDAWLAAEERRLDGVKKIEKTKYDLQLQTFKNIAAVGKTFGKEFFRITQAAGIAHAWISTRRAMAKAKAEVAYPWNYAAAASELIYGAAQVAKIASQSYAHGGLTNVPREQTMLVNKGERILSPNQNKDLTSFINNGGGGGIVIENMNILPNATNAEALLDMSAADWEEIVETNILPALKSLDNRGFAIA